MRPRRVAGLEQPFRSALRDHLKGHTEALEDLAVEMLARGLSVRDIEDAFKDETGRLLLSKTAVAEIGKQLWEDYQAFKSRDLAEYDIAYLFIDGIAERIRPGQRREPVLAAWGFTFDGRKVLLHLMAGSKEDAETVSAFFQDMRGRGLGDPLLVVSDGAPGVIKAVEVCFPRSSRQRCLAHRMRNLAAKVPEDLWPEFKARATAAYQAPSRKIARELAEGLVADYGTEFANATACFRDDFEACIAHLRLPIAHRRATRTTNLLERLFVEERRRLKIIPNAFGEKAVLKLMFGAMTRAAERWRSIRITEFERRQMAALRQELDQDYEAAVNLDTTRSKPAPTTKIPGTIGLDRSDQLPCPQRRLLAALPAAAKPAAQADVAEDEADRGALAARPEATIPLSRLAVRRHAGYPITSRHDFQLGSIRLSRSTK
jgi:transposase-like protein